MTPANRSKMMPATIDAASPGFSQDAPNARITTITVATILVITANLQRNAVCFATQEI